MRGHFHRCDRANVAPRGPKQCINYVRLYALLAVEYIEYEINHVVVIKERGGAAAIEPSLGRVCAALAYLTLNPVVGVRHAGVDVGVVSVRATRIGNK